HFCEVVHLRIAQCCETRTSSLWRNENFVSVARKVWQEGYGRVVLADDSATVLLFCNNYLLKERAPCLTQITLACASFCLYSLEDKVGRVNLAMRVWVRHAYDLALVL